MPGLKVRLAGHDQVRQTITNQEGVYEWYGLPPGNYEVSVDLPIGHKRRAAFLSGAPHQRKSAAFRLNENSGVSVDFILMEDTRVSGRVLGPDGKPVPDVCVELEPLTGKGKNFIAYRCSGKDGSFAAKEMPSGAYRLVANPSGQISPTTPFPATYFPGVTNKSAATIVKVIAGQPLQGLDFRLPTMARRVTLAGVLRFADGTPVSAGSVVLTVGNNVTLHTRTHSNGTFELVTLDPAAGELTADVFVDPSLENQCPHWKGKISRKTHGLAAIPIVISPSTDLASIVLTVPLAPCQAWLARRP